MLHCAALAAYSELPNQPIVWCDFQVGCLIARELLPDNPDLAQSLLSTSHHLAEVLVQLGVTAYGKAAIDMALAVQEARADPPRHCRCYSMACRAA